MFRDLITNPYNLYVVVFSAIGTISTAYGLAIIGSTVGQPNFYTYLGLPPQGEPGYDHTTRIIAALNGVNSAGAIIGCCFHVWSSEKFGRKQTMNIGSIILILGGALCAGAVDVAMLIVGRGIAGIGSGILACVVPMYQAEVSTPESRGAMVSVTGIAYAVGYFLAGWLGYACSFMPATSKYTQFSWRFPLAFQCFFPLLFVCGHKFIPYSPRWLISQTRKEEAYNVVCSLHKTKGDSNNIRASEEFFLIMRQHEIDQSLPNKWYDLFKTKPNRKRLLTGALLMFGNQFLGVYVIANYGVLIYGQLGEGSSMSLLLNACWTTLPLFGNTWTALYVDKFGRRKLLLIGSLGCFCSCIFLCALNASYLGTTNETGLRAAVFFCFFYIFWWAFFIDATQYVYVAEIFPNHLRSAGVALSLSCFYLASEITLCVAPIAMDSIGWKFYLVLLCPSFFFIIFLYRYIPETRGRTLEEIGATFGDENIACQWYGLTEEERNTLYAQTISEKENKELFAGEGVAQTIEDINAPQLVS